MAKTVRWARGEAVDYTPVGDVDAGTPIEIAGVVGVALLDIAAGAKGALALDGHFKGAKAEVAISAGDVVGWDADGDPYGGTAGSGAYTNAEADWDFAVGVALYDAAATDSLVCFDLNRFENARDEQIALVRVEDLAAGADISARPVFVHPRPVTLVSIGILTEGAPAGVDDDNTAVIALADDAANEIVSKTYNTAAQPPDTDYEDLGELDATHKVLAAGEHVTLSVTQGATADLPALSLVLRYVPKNA